MSEPSDTTPSSGEVRLKRVMSVLYLLVIVATLVAWALTHHPDTRP